MAAPTTEVRNIPSLMALEIDERPINEIMNENAEMLSVASTPSLTSPARNPQVVYPGALRSGLADFNMQHYDEEMKLQATSMHNLMLAQDVSIPPGVICDLILRYRKPKKEDKNIDDSKEETATDRE